MANLNVEQMNGANVKGGTGDSQWLTWCPPVCPNPTAGTCYPDYTCPCFTIPRTDCAIHCEP